MRPGVRILMYHRVARRNDFDQLVVSPENFQKQMTILAAGYNVLSLSDAVALLASEQKIPRRTVVITFDDGYLDNFTEALPILEKYSLPATIFVTSDFCEQTAAHPRYGVSQQQDGDHRLHLDWSETAQLAQHSLIEIGSHTVSHAHLPRLNDADAVTEINESKRIIDQQLAQNTRYFCYPNGDYFERELQALNDSDYQAAVTVSPGLNRKTTNRFTLRRTEVTDKDSPDFMRYKLEGAFDIIHSVLDKRRRNSFRQLAQGKGKEA